LTKQTASLSLSKPEITDLISTTITQLADNFDIIDSSLADRANDIVSRGLNAKYPFVTTLTPLKGDGSDETDAFQALVNYANSINVPLYLPSGNYLISKSINNILSLVGTPNKTTITLAPDFIKTSFASQFCFTNPNFTNGGYNPTTANNVVVKHISITTTPNSPRSIFGFANIASLEMDDVTITANKVINQSTGRPYAVDALIDLYAACKNVKIHNCNLNNLTYARGATYPWSAGGGGCIWVRNLLGSTAAGALDSNATEHIDIFNNTMNHATSDEAIAVYGVVGKTRKVNVHHNRIYGLDVDPNQIVFYNTLVSVFPLKHSTLGANALVEDVTIADNYISSRSHLYSVMRFGSSADTNVICQRIKSSRNTIVSFVSSDATSGPQAQWVANGSPSGEPAPNLNVLVMRAIQGSASTFANANASLESDNDTLVCSGNANWGITGFDIVNNPTIKGSAYYGLVSCTNVTGGNIEASAVCFNNCRNVTNVNVKTNITDPSTWIALIDATSGRFNLKGVYGTSGGGVCRATATTTSSTYIDIFSNSISMANSSSYAISNGGSAVVTSRLNTITGTLAGGTTGTVISSLNRWGVVTD
jgi:hypothetical protein